MFYENRTHLYCPVIEWRHSAQPIALLNFDLNSIWHFCDRMAYGEPVLFGKNEKKKKKRKRVFSMTTIMTTTTMEKPKMNAHTVTWYVVLTLLYKYGNWIMVTATTVCVIFSFVHFIAFFPIFCLIHQKFNERNYEMRYFLCWDSNS